MFFPYLQSLGPLTFSTLCQWKLVTVCTVWNLSRSPARIVLAKRLLRFDVLHYISSFSFIRLPVWNLCNLSRLFYPLRLLTSEFRFTYLSHNFNVFSRTIHLSGSNLLYVLEKRFKRGWQYLMKTIDFYWSQRISCCRASMSGFEFNFIWFLAYDRSKCFQYDSFDFFYLPVWRFVAIFKILALALLYTVHFLTDCYYHSHL